jgi:hypothetical protein
MMITSPLFVVFVRKQQTLKKWRITTSNLSLARKFEHQNQKHGELDVCIFNVAEERVKDKSKILVVTLMFFHRENMITRQVIRYKLEF